jgi:hypothetical protein
MLGFMEPNSGSIRAGALCALVCLASSVPVAQTEASAAGVGPFAPGSVVVSQAGTIFGGGGGGNGVKANGDVDVYPPNSNGDVAPEASFTNDMYGPTTMAFDPSGDLWVANENTSDLFELSKAQLATHNPVPAVTIFAGYGQLANPFGMAFDHSGNLWVVSNTWSRVYEYTKRQLASSAAPTPVETIFRFPSTPISDAFDASGDLWVSTDSSVVEYSKADLAISDPSPTVVISSSGGAQLAFDPSGDLWIVTGGGPNCFGTPCTNEVLEFTKAQLSTSGSPTPAVTISSTKAGPTGSIYGPYSLAFTPSGDLWVENFDSNTTVEFGNDELSTSGSPTPVRTIVGPRTGMKFPSYVVLAP